MQTALDLIKYKFRVVVGDLGMASAFSSDRKYLFGRKGTPYYYSPEIWFDRKFNEKADVWSMGCLALYLYFNRYMIVFDKSRMNEEDYKKVFHKGKVDFNDP